MKENSAVHVLDLDADRALFSGEVRGLVSLVFQNERPLSGLSGLLDWKFSGAISRYIRAGVITGELGQCIYVPVTRREVTYHLLLLGAGANPELGSRNSVPPEAFRVLQKNLIGLKLDQIAVSRRDLGNLSDEFLGKHLRGCPLWIVN